jgi:hypothetical protein
LSLIREVVIGEIANDEFECVVIGPVEDEEEIGSMLLSPLECMGGGAMDSIAVGM